MKKQYVRLIVLAVSFAFIVLPAVSQSDSDAVPAAAQAITSAYSLTKTGFGSADRITKPGTIYVVRIDGLLARAIANHVTPTNTVKDGKLVPPAKGFLGAFGTSGDTEQVKPGQRFYVHEIEVKDDSIVFTLISLDTVSTVVQGHSTHSRLRLYLKFSVGKNGAAALTPAAVHQLTDPIFLPEGSPSLIPTVQLGQSEADVRRIMGDPEKEIDLGAKKVLVYKDIKVTLVDDKVTDAE